MYRIENSISLFPRYQVSLRGSSLWKSVFDRKKEGEDFEDKKTMYLAFVVPPAVFIFCSTHKLFPTESLL